VLEQLSNIYELHRTLCTAFPANRDPERILFRVEDGKESHIVIVQSKGLPDWSRVNEKDDYFIEPPEHKPFTPKVANGQALVFRIRSNPTVKKDGKRLGLIKSDDQLEWLNRKAKAGGFDLVQLQVVPAGIVNAKKAGATLSFYSVTFQGALKVVDKDKFIETLANGIGSGKGMGFGLLSVARV